MREVYANNNATTHVLPEVVGSGDISIGAPLW
jgi:hypothetical protein